jgi:1-acyl-sn-glycerol-3-phosphate acyltransferase
VLYDVAYYLVRAILGLFLRVRVAGRENVPEGAFLVVSNHLSWTDTLFIMYALPRRPMIHTMANRSTVFNKRWKRWLLPKFGVFPVTRSRGFLDEDAVNTVYDLLNMGERVLIFPEGAYGRDGELRPLKEGIGHFAINSGKPLLPIVLTGTGSLRPWGRVEVVIGKPFIPTPPRMWDVKKRVRAAVDAVGQAFQKLGARIGRAPAGSGPDAAQAVGVEGGDAEVAGGQPDDD